MSLDVSTAFRFLFDITNHTHTHLTHQAQVAELVDALDLKSSGHYGRTGSIPVPGTSKYEKEARSSLLRASFVFIKPYKFL